MAAITIPLAGAWLWDKFGKDVLKTAAKGLWTGVNWLDAARHYRDNLHRQYAHIQIFGQPEPVPLEGIFTHVHILEQATALQRYDVELLREAVRQDPARFHAAARGLGERAEKVDGLELVARPDSQRIFILGKPGAGKTTFLKYLTIQAAKGKIERVPIFISLKGWADSELDLLPYIARQFEICDFPDPQPLVEMILRQGRALVLFDGLDEVNREARERMRLLPSLVDFGKQYLDSQILITCRIAASDYVFEGFKYVEIADFNEGQMLAFARKWFKDDQPMRDKFWSEFNKDENQGLRELARSPLLLALLCLSFAETRTFPQRRVEIYEESLDALLKKWDTSRQIERDTIYHKLSLGRKRQMFARLAAQSFETGTYFFRQGELEKQILAYLHNLPPADQEEDIDGTVVLKAIEAQHSIFVERARRVYAFAHLTFQEYFTAKYIVDNASKGTLPRLLAHYTDNRWREVILLTASLLDDADDFFVEFRRVVDGLIAGDEHLVAFIRWVADKSTSVESNNKPAAVRSCYGYLALDRALDLALARDHAIALALDFTLDLDLDLTLTLDLDLEWEFSREQAECLTAYFEANRLLVECLNLAYVSNRTKIEDSLLLPPPVSGP